MSKHVHIHLGRKTAERQAAARKEVTSRLTSTGRVVTADADGEGKWVTINGAHVQIGAGGKITKGPAALVGKTHGEAHEHAAAHHEKAHAEAANRGDGIQAGKHAEAADTHKAAAKAHKSGDPTAHEASAHAEMRHAATQTVTSTKPKPKAHEKLHQETGAQVKAIGSKKHSDEHDKLMDRYGKAQADWERSAINRQIEKNLNGAKDHHLAKHDQAARDASAAAHKSGKPEDHAKAAEALKKAVDLHGSTGGVGYVKKQEELTAMRKGHEAAAKKAGLEDRQATLREQGSPRYSSSKMAQASNERNATPTEPVTVAKGDDHKTGAKSIPPKLPYGGKAMPEGQSAGHKALQHSQIAKSHRQQANIDGGVGDKHSAAKHNRMAEGHEAAAQAHLDGKPDAAALSEAAHKQTATHHPEFGKTLYEAKDKKVHAAAKKMGPGEAAHAAAAHMHSTHADTAKRGGDEKLAAMHREKAKHHEHIANNPGEDHSARGAKLQELRGKIDEHEKAKKKLMAKPSGKAPSKPASASNASSSVQGATEALKGLKAAVKKTGEISDPDPKKQS